MPAQIGGFLVHDGVTVLLRVVAFQRLDMEAQTSWVLSAYMPIGEGRELQRHILIVQDDGLIIVIFSRPIRRSKASYKRSRSV